jgi:hypothetical protein
MTLDDAVEIMTLNVNYQEYYQLKIRCSELEKILKKYKEGTLPFTPACSYELLHEQLVYMTNYLKVLQTRAHIEHVEV